jgi:transposase
VVTVRGMPYPSDLTDEQWNLLEPVFNAPGKRGRRHADDLRSVVDATALNAATCFIDLKTGSGEARFRCPVRRSQCGCPR